MNLTVFSQSYRIVFPNNPLEVKYAQEADSLQVYSIIYRVKNQYLSKGYLAVNTDSIVWGRKEVNVYLYTGSEYRIGLRTSI